MRFRFQPWQLAILLVLLCAGAIAGVYLYQNSGGHSPAEMVSYLPLGDGALVYLDVASMRRSGLLDLIAGKKATAEVEYQSFVDETRFDYRDDLDGVAALFKDGQEFMTLSGRFNWKSIMAYVNNHGGYCYNGFCTVTGSRPDRRVSFYPIRGNLMAMAVSRDSWAAYQISHKPAHLPIVPPRQPVWAVLTGPALKNLAGLPSGTKAFVTALSSANELVFAVGEKDDQLELSANVKCQTKDQAAVLLSELQSATSTLRDWLTREHQQPNPNDMSGILTGGTFHRDDRQVFGSWPVRRSFIESMASGTN